MNLPGMLRLAGQLQGFGLPGVDATLRLLFPLTLTAKRYWAGVVTRADGLRMHVDTRRHIERVYLVRGQYEPHLAALMRSILRPGDRAIDIGANVGGHTLTMAQIVGPSGQVFAYEPNDHALSDLRRNLDLNALQNVTLRPVAVGDAPGNTRLRIPLETSVEGVNAGLASIEALETPHRKVDVPVVTIDSEIAPSHERPIRLVKIDVQGYEPRAFLGMERLLRTDRPSVLFECDKWALGQSGFDTVWLWDFFDRCGYVITRSDDEPGGAPTSRDALASEVSRDYVAVPRAGLSPGSAQTES